MSFMFEHWFEDEPADITRGELNRMGRTATYNPDEFFSAERYPLPMKCPECGKTMRPVHKHCVPDMPKTYFCTFCGAGFYEDNPNIRFSKKPTNYDVIRNMSIEELAEWISYDCTGDGYGNSAAEWLKWLKEEVK